MRFRKEKVDTYVEFLYCECGGDYIHVKTVPLKKPIYNYICNKCGHKLSIREQYPKLIYERLDENINKDSTKDECVNNE